MAEGSGGEQQPLRKEGDSVASGETARKLAEKAASDLDARSAVSRTEREESERQIRSMRVPGTIWAGTVPLVMLVILYGLALFADLPVPVMIAFAIGTFSSFIVIYSFILSGLYRITSQKPPEHPASKVVRSISDNSDKEE